MYTIDGSARKPQDICWYLVLFRFTCVRITAKRQVKADLIPVEILCGTEYGSLV